MNNLSDMTMLLIIAALLGLCAAVLIAVDNEPEPEPVTVSYKGAM